MDSQQSPRRRRRPVPLAEEMEQLIHDVIGAAIEVHRALGPGLTEEMYEEALSIEFEASEIPFERNAAYEITYDGRKIGEGTVDMLVDERLLIDVKTVRNLAQVHADQMAAILRAKELQAGLLINFQANKLKDGLKRIVV